MKPRADAGAEPWVLVSQLQQPCKGGGNGTDLLANTPVFSRKGRRPTIQEAWHDALFANTGGIARNLGGKALLINGVADHVNLLLSLPATIAVAGAARVIKARSSTLGAQPRSNLRLAIGLRNV